MRSSLGLFPSADDEQDQSEGHRKGREDEELLGPEHEGQVLGDGREERPVSAALPCVDALYSEFHRTVLLCCSRQELDKTMETMKLPEDVRKKMQAKLQV